MFKLAIVVLALAGLWPSTAFCHRNSLSGLTVSDLRWYCMYNGRLFSVGAILCAGEKRGFKCIAGEATGPTGPTIAPVARWTTDASSNAPENDGCKTPTPLN